LLHQPANSHLRGSAPQLMKMPAHHPRKIAQNSLLSQVALSRVSYKHHFYRGQVLTYCARLHK
jgi:hypothetical protein